MQVYGPFASFCCFCGPQVSLTCLLKNTFNGLMTSLMIGNSLLGLCKLSRLRRLYVNENELDFQGIPPGMGKLGAMEIFSAADNQVGIFLKLKLVESIFKMTEDVTVIKSCLE